ncbi:MAG: PHP domain-containing protein [Acidobacteriota bacterium]|nr:PHP domain-containing protein [Acidobacteriota bacterium]MDQ3418002.1 PHP domain-containing protein [Acidobacteriota bacterium]
MRPPTLADQLRQLACIAEIRGGADAGDLRQAVSALDRRSPEEMARLAGHLHAAPSDDITEFPPAALWRLREFVSGRADGALRASRAGLPLLLRRLLELKNIDEVEAVTLARDLRVVTLSDLRDAIADGRVNRLLKPAAGRLRAGAEIIGRDVRPMPLGRAVDVLSAVQDGIAHHCPLLEDVGAAGDVRRFEPLVSQLVLVGQSSSPPAAVASLCAMPDVDDVLHRTPRRVVLWIHQVEVDVRVAAYDDYGTVLFGATGSSEHVRAVSSRRRLSLHQNEEQLYAHAGVAFIPAEMRNHTGEIAAAAAGPLPEFVSRADIRGDLHMHSTYSDGQDTLPAMVAACVAIGYEYMAITDHSERAAASRTLSLDTLARQRDEILRLRAQYPQITILHGVEVDILADGRLDFADDILEQLDIVLASLHDSAKQDGPALTRRCLQAIRHPLVNVITHPANQLVGRRPGYALDFPVIYAAAAETGTALEIDGAPSHLDLDGEHARTAVSAGVTVTIDSDCHRARALDRQMRLGIGTARRGWVEARHVLNCRPLDEVLGFIAAKRTGRSRRSARP